MFVFLLPDETAAAGIPAGGLLISRGEREKSRTFRDGTMTERKRGD